MLPVGKAIELKVAARPIKIRLGHIDRGGGLSTPQSCVYGSRSSIGKQVEEALTPGLLAYHETGGTVVQKKTRVQIVREVYQQLSRPLRHRVEYPRSIKFIILRSTALALTHFEINALGINFQSFRQDG